MMLRCTRKTTLLGSRALVARNFSSSKDRCYLHVGPAAGDVWTGTSLFAAKHLQPDYVKSVLLPVGWGDDDERTDTLLKRLEGNPELQHQIYDTGFMDPAMLADINKIPKGTAVVAGETDSD